MGRNGEAGKRAGQKRTAVARQVKRENENANSLAKHFASAVALCGNLKEEEEEEEEEGAPDPHHGAAEIRVQKPEDEQGNHDGRDSGDEEEDPDSWHAADTVAERESGFEQGRDSRDGSSSSSSSSQQDGVKEPEDSRDESNHECRKREDSEDDAPATRQQEGSSSLSGQHRKMDSASTFRSSSFGGQRGGAFAAPSSSKPWYSSSSNLNRTSSSGAEAPRGGAFKFSRPKVTVRLEDHDDEAAETRKAAGPHRTAAGPLTAAPELDHYSNSLPQEATTMMSWREPIIDRSSSSSSSSSSRSGKQGGGGGEGGNGETQLEFQSPDREVPPWENDTDEDPDEVTVDQGDTMLTASFTDIGESDDSWREDSSSGDAAGNTTESDSDCSQGEEQRQSPAETEADDAEADRGGGGGGGRGRGRGGNTRDSAIGEGRNAAEPTTIPRPDFESLLTKESVANLAEVDGLRVENVNIKALESLSTCPYEGACYLPKANVDYKLIIATSPVNVVIEDKHIPVGITVNDLRSRICNEISSLGKAVSPPFIASSAKRKKVAAAVSNMAQTRSTATGRHQPPTESEKKKEFCFHKMRKLTGHDIAKALQACGILEVTVFVYGNAAKVGGSNFHRHPYLSHYYGPGCKIELDVAMTLRCDGHMYMMSSGDALHTKTYPVDAEMSTCSKDRGRQHGTLLITPQSQDCNGRPYMDFPCSNFQEQDELNLLGTRHYGISSIKIYSPSYHVLSAVSKVDVQNVGILTKTINSKLDQCEVILEEYEALLATCKGLVAGSTTSTHPYASGIRIETRFRRECPAGALTSEDMNALIELARQVSIYLVRRIGFQRVDVDRSMQRSKAMLEAARTIFAGKRGEKALKMHRDMMAILLQTMGFTGPVITNFAVDKTTQTVVKVPLREYEHEADDIREVQSLTQKQVLEEMVLQVSAEDTGGGGGWRAHARGTTRFIGGEDHASLAGAPLFVTKRKLCVSLAAAFGRRWRLYIEMLPAERRAQEALRTEREASRKARDVPYPVCPPVGIERGIGQLHSWKRTGDRSGSGKKCLSHATIDARVDEMLMTHRLMDDDVLLINLDTPPSDGGAQHVSYMGISIVATPVIDEVDAGGPHEPENASALLPCVQAQAVPARVAT